MKKDLIECVIGKEDEGVKLDSILKTRLNLSRRIIIGLKKSNNIFLNNEPVHTGILVKEGDLVSVNISKEESQDIEPQDIPIDVVYEDKDLLVINKQPGIVVHPTQGHPEGTLSNGIMFHWKQSGEDAIVRLVNRLDRDTSGLIIIAKNQFSHQAMAKQLDANIVQKTYLAVVHGVVEKDLATIDLPIDRPSWESIKREVTDAGQRSVTHYKVLERFKDASLLEVSLETGRTHQIRVHLDHIGHPIYGDTLYGTIDDSEYIGRQALHAFKLSFNHPRTGDRMELSSKLPDDMKLLEQKLK